MNERLAVWLKNARVHVQSAQTRLGRAFASPPPPGRGEEMLRHRLIVDTDAKRGLAVTALASLDAALRELMKEAKGA